jgi:PAS domain S-box-containing protein
MVEGGAVGRGRRKPENGPAGGRGSAPTSGSDGWRILFWIVFGRTKNPMLLLDRDRRILAANAAESELVGHRREQLVGRRIDVLLDPEEWGSLDGEWRAFQRRGDVEGERACRRADGRRVDVQYAARRVRLEGRIVALLVVLDSTVEPLRLREAEPGPPALLTPREVEVVGHIAMGQRAHEIAEDLGIAESTVRSHIRNAMVKSGARSQAQLVAMVCCGQMPRVPATA